MAAAAAAIPAAVMTVAKVLPAMAKVVPLAMQAVPTAIGAKMAGTAAAANLPTGGSLYPLIEGGLEGAAGAGAGGGLPSWMTLGNLGQGIGAMGTLDQMLQQPGGGMGMAPGQPVQFAPPEMAPSPGANLPSPFTDGGSLLTTLPPEILRLLGMI